MPAGRSVCEGAVLTDNVGSGRVQLAASLLLACAVGIAAATVFFGWRGRVPFPEPEFLTILDDFRRFGLAHALWAPIEGHRMAVPRALQFLDYGVFGGTNLVTLAVVWVMSAVAFLWIFAAAMGTLGRDRLLRGAVLCLGASLVFGPYYAIYAHGQHANFAVAWFFSVASICVFFAANRRGGAFNVGHGVATLLGWTAGLSLLPGLFVWPVQAYLAILERNWRLLLAVVGGSVPIVFVQAGGSQVGGANQVIALFSDPLGAIAWIARYTGSIFGQALFFEPLSRASGVVSVSCGVFGLAIVVALALWLLWRPRALPRESPLAVGVLLLALLWIVAAAAKHPEAEGLLDRYFFIVGWFWFALVLLTVAGLKNRRSIRSLASAAALATILILGPNHALTSLRVDAQGSLYDAAQIAVAAGVDDPQLYGSLLLVSPRDPLWNEMRRRREAPFDSPQVVERVDAARLGACAERRVEAIQLQNGGWRLRGDLPAGAGWIFVLDDNSDITGVGRHWREPIAPRFLPKAANGKSSKERWWGYARLDPTDPNVAVVAFDRGGAPLCRFALSDA